MLLMRRMALRVAPPAGRLLRVPAAVRPLSVSSKGAVPGTVSDQAQAVLDAAARLGVPLRTLSPAAAERLAKRISGSEPVDPSATGAAAAGLHPTPEGLKALTLAVLGPDVQAELARRGREDGARDEERRVLLELVSAEHVSASLGQRVLNKLDLLGTALFASVGCQLAGEAGMHVVGATLVGCVSALGGGTLNNVIFGDTRGGVFWARDPRFLAVAAGASVLTFFVWPELEKAAARAQLESMGAVGPDGTVGLAGFSAALEGDEGFARRLRAAVGHSEGVDGPSRLSAAGLFEWLDVDRSGSLELAELVRLVRLEARDSPILYAMDSVALGALGVLGAQGGLRRGLHPGVAVAAGVSICFGGVLRDLLCHRDVALGSSSFALATFGGAAAYVGATELNVKLGAPGLRLPLGARIGIGVATCLATRAAAWHRSGDLLPPMANYASERRS